MVLNISLRIKIFLLLVSILFIGAQSTRATSALLTGSIISIDPTGYILGRVTGSNNSKLQINFYLDGPSGTEAWIGDAHTIPNGYFYFQIPIERIEDGQRHRVYVYAFDPSASESDRSVLLIAGKAHDIPIVYPLSPHAFTINNVMLASPTSTSITLVVHTSHPSNITVEYGQNSNYGSRISSSNLTIHKILISGLTANHLYHYRLTAQQVSNLTTIITKSDKTFKTQAPPGQAFTFGITSDNQGQNWSAIASRLQEHSPTLLLGIGDHSDNYVLNKINRFDYYLRQWQLDIFNYTQNLTDHISSYFIMGNHDYLSQPSSGKLPVHVYEDSQKYFKQIFANPIPSDSPDTNYSFEYGDAHFATLETFDSCPSESQLTWLDQDLKKTNRIWKIILMHIPNINPGMTSTTTQSRGNCLFTNPERAKLLHNIFKTNKVDLVINGHSHTYSRWVKDGVYYLTNSTSGNYTSHNSPTSIMNIFDLPFGETGTLNPPRSIAGSGYMVGSITSSEIKISVFKADELSTVTGIKLLQYTEPKYAPIDAVSIKKNLAKGDLNQDGFVNIIDYNELVSHFGSTYDISHYNDIIKNYDK